jgi:hypothetical protein
LNASIGRLPAIRRLRPWSLRQGVAAGIVACLISLRRQRDRTGIVPAGIFDERGDAAFDRRVRVE